MLFRSFSVERPVLYKAVYALLADSQTLNCLPNRNIFLMLRYHVGDNCVLFLNQADFRHDVEQRLVRVPVIKAFPGDPELFCDPNQLQLILCVPVYLPCLIAVEAKQSSHLRNSHGSLFGNFVPFTVITVPIPVLRGIPLVKNLLWHTQPPGNNQGGPALFLNQITDALIMQREHVSNFRYTVELRLQHCAGLRTVYLSVLVLMRVPLFKAGPDNTELMIDRHGLKMMLVEQIIAFRFLEPQHSAHCLYGHGSSFSRSHSSPSLLVC